MSNEYTTITVDMTKVNGSTENGTLTVYWYRTLTLANGEVIAPRPQGQAFTVTAGAASISLAATDATSGANPQDLPYLLKYTDGDSRVQVLGQIQVPTSLTTVDLADLLDVGAAVTPRERSPVDGISGLFRVASITAAQSLRGLEDGDRVLVEDEGLYRFDEDSAATALGNLVVTHDGGRLVLEVDGKDYRQALNVKLFGATGNGVTDDSSAIAAAIAYAESLISSSTVGVDTSNRRGNVELYFPAGTYLVTSAETLMRSSFTTRTLGLTIKGAGRGVSRILFQPTASAYLMKNQDAWLHIHLQDLEFNGNGSNCNFMYSYATGGAQNYTFERVNWSGTWNYVFLLEGTNVNSEMTWFHCGCNGTVSKFLYVPSSTGSDQFLNYNFFSMQFEVASGDFLHFEKGGNINVWGGSFIHTQSAGGTFFKADVGSHALGVQRLLVIGSRFELRTRASVLCDIRWDDGAVSFINCDTSSSCRLSTGTLTNGSNSITAVTNAAYYWTVGDAIRSISGNIPAGTTVTAVGESTLTLSANATSSTSATGLLNETRETAKFTVGNQKLASVKFDNCALMGRHQYTNNLSSWNYPHNIIYENCEFLSHKYPSTFIYNVENASHANVGSRPVIQFRNCRAIDNDQTAIWDSTANFTRAMVGIGEKKTITLKNAAGGLPTAGNTVQVVLPLNAIITRIVITSPSGANTAFSEASFRVETNEATPTVLAKVRTQYYANGFGVEKQHYFQCTSDETRTIKFVSVAAGQASTTGMCLIEYI